MTRNEFRNSKEYAELIERIRNYKPGFTFTAAYAKARKVSKAKENGLKILMEDAVKMGLLESISIGYSLEDLRDGEITEEKFKRR